MNFLLLTLYGFLAPLFVFATFLFGVKLVKVWHGLPVTFYTIFGTLTHPAAVIVWEMVGIAALAHVYLQLVSLMEKRIG